MANVEHANILNFRVAGLKFSVSSGATLSELQSLLPSYRTFYEKEATGDAPLFELFAHIAGEGEQPSQPAAQPLHTFDEPDIIQEFYAEPQGGHSIRIYTHPRSLAAIMHASADWRQARAEIFGNTDTQSYALGNVIMMLYALTALDANALLIHASVIEHGGKGFIFQGKSGTGKSTHSRLWLKYITDTALLNDDNPVVRFMPDGTVRVFGTPWSGKTPCYINRSVPVGAFVRLFQAPENKIERMQPPLSGASIIGSSSGMRWDKDFYTRMLQLSFGIAKQTGIFTLHCLPDEEAARICHATVTR